MSQSDWMDRFRKLGLQPFQASFASSLVASEPPFLLLLVAPPGMGKTMSYSCAIAEGVAARKFSRCLCLTPRQTIGSKVAFVLKGMISDDSVVLVDRRRLREYEEQASIASADVWPTEGVFVTTIDFARRPDVSWSFFSAKWDLIVVDVGRELKTNSLELHFVLGVLARESTRVAVVFSSSHQATMFEDIVKPAGLIPKIEKMVWEPGRVKDWNGKSLLSRQVHWECRYFVLSDSERELYMRLGVTSRTVKEALGEHALIAENLSRRAKSSISCVERSLLSLRDWVKERRQAAEHLEPGARKTIEEVSQHTASAEMREKDAGTMSELVDRYKKAARAIETAIADIEQVEDDSKSATLSHILKNDFHNKRICVVSQYDATVSYLETVLEEACESAPIALNGRMSPHEIMHRLSEYRAHGGVLLATDSSLKGVAVPDTDVVVHYDIPLAPERLYLRATRFYRWGSDSPLKMVALLEESPDGDFERVKEMWERQANELEAFNR